MAFTGNITCNTFKTGLMNGSFNFNTDTFYIALYTNAATLDYSTTEYTTNGEVVASGYSALPLTVTVTPTTGNSGTVSYISFANVSWTASFTARGALIYKPGANGAVCVLDFGSDKTSTTTFTVQFPAATNTSAIIRIA
jgi:hypothetical protein